MQPIQKVDDVAFRWVADAEHGPFDSVLAAASRATDYSMLWGAVAVLLALFGGPRGRRAALRGWLAIGINSLALNHPIKLLVRRQRPDLDLVPDDRHPVTTTTTHAFPSGHTGSAVAFTVGATRELPRLAWPLAVVAGLVGYSRVHAGMHHPTDVAAGATTGLVSGLLSHRVWDQLPLSWK